MRAGQGVVRAVLDHQPSVRALSWRSAATSLKALNMAVTAVLVRQLGLLGLDLEQQALGTDVLDEGDRRGALDLEVAAADRRVDLGVDRMISWSSPRCSSSRAFWRPAWPLAALALVRGRRLQAALLGHTPTRSP
jgi:hypothetical protein